MTASPHNTPAPSYPTPGFPPLPDSPQSADIANHNSPNHSFIPKPSTPWLAAFLLLLTAAAAFLRYWRIGHQPYWTDEAWTITRVQGSFANMINLLSKEETGQGLLPPWYALLRWWCLTVEGFTGSGALAFSPASTRALPALFGTLTVPAMYYLARQFTDRRGALVVTLLAAVNPFLIYYSRDIKMYAPFWFFVVLNMAYFFRWQTTHRHIVYFPLFVLTGIAMASLHSMAWFIIALQLIFLLTRAGLRALDGPLWLAGVGLMTLYPTYWFFEVLQPGRVIGRVAGASNSGMLWQVKYTDMSWRTIAGLPTAHLLGYLWPIYPPNARITDWFSLGDDFKDHLDTRSIESLAQWQWYAALALFTILIAGLFPWRNVRRRPATPSLAPVPATAAPSMTHNRWWWVALWIVIPTTALALTWIPKDSPWHARIWHNMDPKSIWEPRYLGIVLPAWLLWLGASLCRLPTLPVRILATTALVSAGIFSTTSNYLIYRNAPFQRAAEIAEPFINHDLRTSAAMSVPTVEYAEKSEDIALTEARHLRPITPITAQDRAQLAENIWSFSDSPEEIPLWLRSTAQRPRIQTIILTDRYGDLTDPADPLSSDSLSTLLGPTWHLAHEESYRWYYEWRFYIFHIWRTRVWQRTTVD